MRVSPTRQESDAWWTGKRAPKARAKVRKACVVRETTERKKAALLKRRFEWRLSPLPLKASALCCLGIDFGLKFSKTAPLAFHAGEAVSARERPMTMRPPLHLLRATLILLQSKRKLSSSCIRREFHKQAPPFLHGHKAFF